MSEPRQPKTLRTDARAMVEACAGWNSRLAARRITAFLDREMAELRLSAAQVGLMAQIAVIADDTLGALARRTGLEQSTLSRNLRTLEAAGLVEIAVVEGDLRRRAVWLTEPGARRERLRDLVPPGRRIPGIRRECRHGLLLGRTLGCFQSGYRGGSLYARYDERDRIISSSWRNY